MRSDVSNVSLKVSSRMIHACTLADGVCHAEEGEDACVISSDGDGIACVCFQASTVIHVGYGWILRGFLFLGKRNWRLLLSLSGKVALEFGKSIEMVGCCT